RTGVDCGAHSSCRRLEERVMTTSPITIEGAQSRSAAMPVMTAIVLAIAAAGLAIEGARADSAPIATAGAVLVVSWALLTIFLAARRPAEPMWAWTGVGSLIGGIAVASPDNAAGLVPLAAFAIALALPAGTLPLRASRMLAILGATVGIPLAIGIG